jgi:ferredoxin
MNHSTTRRHLIKNLGKALAGVFSFSLARRAKAAVQTALVSTPAPTGYDPTRHKWLMAIDINRCIGCGLCAQACKTENHVPLGAYFRTWIERYIIKKPPAAAAWAWAA